jgi:hypothetical protein
MPGQATQEIEWEHLLVQVQRQAIDLKVSNPKAVVHELA